MSWDFSTEPDFETKLEWMRGFMRDEVYPLEVLDTDEAGFMRAIRPLQAEVKRQKLWATHLPPDLGGQGYGQVKLGLMHEIEGASVWGPIIFGNQAPDSGNSEVLAHFGTEAQKKRWLYPLLDLGCLCVVSHRRNFKDAPNPGGSVDVPLQDLYDMYRADPGEMNWYVAMSLYKYAAIFGYNLMLHRRGKRPDPMYEGLTTTITGMIEEGIQLLDRGV